eukprot:TRINITY_DN2078_c0_g2_i5.p1 TRINITY_DN2078_c0_g2~~TRINITY_DN2078_c0_g2_i5.p1  ORF type:complete len:200 (-),score=33.20 TRINITY_DN2078_c0_g2_i5:102-701(-)
MFWGCNVSENNPYTLPKDLQEELLHISNAALSSSCEPGKNYLMITKDNETFAVGMLQKDKVETLFLDMYTRTAENIKLTVVGKSEVSVIGYLEPNEKSPSASLVGSNSNEEVKEESKGFSAIEVVEIKEDDDSGTSRKIQEINSRSESGGEDNGEGMEISEEDSGEMVARKRPPKKELDEHECKKRRMCLLTLTCLTGE